MDRLTELVGRTKIDYTEGIGGYHRRSSKRLFSWSTRYSCCLFRPRDFGEFDLILTGCSCSVPSIPVRDISCPISNHCEISRQYNRFRSFLSTFIHLSNSLSRRNLILTRDLSVNYIRKRKRNVVEAFIEYIECNWFMWNDRKFPEIWKYRSDLVTFIQAVGNIRCLLTLPEEFKLQIMRKIFGSE